MKNEWICASVLLFWLVGCEPARPLGSHENEMLKRKEMAPHQLKNAQSDVFAKTHFPDMVEGDVIKNVDGSNKDVWVRTKINDPRIDGPIETGWGFKDFEDQHNLIGLPNPLKE